MVFGLTKCLLGVINTGFIPRGHNVINTNWLKKLMKLIVRHWRSFLYITDT